MSGDEILGAIARVRACPIRNVAPEPGVGRKAALSDEVLFGARTRDSETGLQIMNLNFLFNLDGDALGSRGRAASPAVCVGVTDRELIGFRCGL